jgi:hypothetical protein
LEIIIALSLITLYFYLIHLFPIETTIRSASQGGRPDRKPYHFYVSEIHTKHSINEGKTKILYE